VRKVIILGAGEDQLPVYDEAMSKALHTIAFDKNPSAVAFAHSSEKHVISTRQTGAIIEAIGETPIDAVLAPSSDASQASAYRLSRHFNVPASSSPKAIAATTNKAYFRRIVERCGLPTYRAKHGHALEDLLAWAKSIDGPVVVKPIDRSGSAGVRYIERKADASSAIVDAIAQSYRQQAIVEEALPGTHFTADFVIHDGRLIQCLVARKEILYPRMLTKYLEAPFILPETARDLLERSIRTIALALNYRCGIGNVDFVLVDDERPYLVEMNARLSGNGVPALLRAAYGVNLARMALRFSLGQSPETHRTPAPKRFLMYVLGVKATGVFERVQRRAGITDPSDIQLSLFKSPGDPVSAFTQSAHKVGYLLVGGDTRAVLRDRLGSFLQNTVLVCRDGGHSMECPFV
jgi:biotin carboxylase